MGNLCSADASNSASNASVRANKPTSLTRKDVDISVAEFLSVCIFLSEKCGNIIREVHESNDLKTVAKGVENPVTIADLKVQKTIEVCLNTLYPTLKVMGEESKESIANVDPVIKPSVFTDAIKESISTEDLNQSQEARRDWIRDTLRQYYDEDDV